MSRQLRIEYSGAFYHITSRGNEKNNIFSSDSDKAKLLDYFENAYKRFGIIIHAFCLMTNHFHLIMETLKPNLSRCMQYINSSDATWYNRKHRRGGHLFQGRYKAILIEEEPYLIRLSRYIHLNPVRAKMVRSPEEYFWSSYSYVIGAKNPPEFLDIDSTLSYFNGRRKEYREYVEEGIAGRIKNPLLDTVAGMMLGSGNFVNEIKKKYLDDGKKSRDLPGLRALMKNVSSTDKIIKVVNEMAGSLTTKEKAKTMVYFLRKYTDSTLEEIAKDCKGDVTAAAVSNMVFRLHESREKNRRLDVMLNKIEEKMCNDEV